MDKRSFPTPGKRFWSYLLVSMLLTMALGMYLDPLLSIVAGYTIPALILAAAPLVRKYVNTQPAPQPDTNPPTDDSHAQNA